jgi:hypothetical protein
MEQVSVSDCCCLLGKLEPNLVQNGSKGIEVPEGCQADAVV